MQPIQNNRASMESPTKNGRSDEVTTSAGTSIFSGSLKSTNAAEHVKKLDAELQKRLSNNFVSVRKAFLDLDEDHKGYITPEQLAKLLGATKRSNFDFSMLEILTKLKTKGMKTQINYNDFCAWFGNAIEPKESFFFRHDSKKNPQFEINLAKAAAKTDVNKSKVSATIVKKDLKERFV